MNDIEIHVSDISTFKSCRVRWDFGSHMRRYLEPDLPVVHFMLGRAVHYALSQYYEGKDVSEAYQEYMERDVVLIQHLDSIEGDMKSKILDNIVLGRGMVAHYASWAPKHDEHWEVLATELPFEFTMPGYILAGRFDGIWRHKPTGELWIQEFKTTSGSNVEWIYDDEQPLVYAWAAEQILNEPIEGILYTFLWKKVPGMPKRLTSGSFSKSLKQNTTAELFVDALKADARVIAAGDDEAYYRLLKGSVDGYKDVLVHFLNQKNKYFWRRQVRKTRTELNIAMEYINGVAYDMLRSPTIYPAPDMIKCMRCQFRDPCRILRKGGDFELILNEDYRERLAWDNQLATDRKEASSG